MGALLVIGLIVFCIMSNSKTDKNNVRDDNQITVICPHCDKKVFIKSEGEWVCPHCNKEFNYYRETNRNNFNRQEENSGTYSNKFSVKCPYCNNSCNIHSEGSWICPDCEKTFVYRDSRIMKDEECCGQWIIYLVEVLAKIAKADGTVSKKEIDVFSEILNSELQLNYYQKKEVESVFNREKSNPHNYEKPLLKIYDLFSDDRSILFGLLDMMFKIAAVDNYIHPEQEKVLKRAGNIFGFSDYEYLDVKNRYIENLDQYYGVLNCNKNSSIEEIKKSYRKLLLTYHPDKYVSKDLPLEMMNLAKEKTQEIQEAYEKIRLSRGF